MTPLLTLSVLLASYSYFVAGQTECATKNGVKESCVISTQCESMKDVLQNNTPANQAVIAKATCGWIGTTPMVCCPTSKCITLDGEQGTCIHPSLCPHVVSIAQNITTDIEFKRRLLSRLRCDGPESVKVCCAPSPSTLQPTSTIRSKTLNGECHLTSIPPERSSRCCGIDSSGGSDRIYGGTETSVYEYPWLTVIEYEKNNTINLYCGGALISGRYVLTAAHCVTGKVLDQGTPVNVRLGEYDISKSGPDCVTVAGGGEECTDGERIIPIEKTIPHPDYKSWSIRRRHDIALIRLDRVVEYTEFIRPICLPSTDFTEAATANLNLFVAGWGAVSTTQSQNNIKLAVTLPYVSNQDCQTPYMDIDRRMRLWDGQACAGGEIGKDACKGDSGGPLQRRNGKIFELIGIVSYGASPCGTEGFANVFTKVYKYIPWINSQIVE